MRPDGADVNDMQRLYLSQYRFDKRASEQEHLDNWDAPPFDWADPITVLNKLAVKMIPRNDPKGNADVILAEWRDTVSGQDVHNTLELTRFLTTAVWMSFE